MFMLKINFFKSLAVALFCMVILSSCEQNTAVEEEGAEIKRTGRKIISFQVLRRNNASLPSDITAKIDEDKKELSLTFRLSIDLRTKLIPSFKLSEGASLKVGNTKLVSGKTQVDFSSVTTYTVHAEDGATQVYTVKVLR